MNTTGLKVVIDTNVFLVSNDLHFGKLKQIDFPKINVKTLKEFELEAKQ